MLVALVVVHLDRMLCSFVIGHWPKPAGGDKKPAQVAVQTMFKQQGPMPKKALLVSALALALFRKFDIYNCATALHKFGLNSRDDELATRPLLRSIKATCSKLHVLKTGRFSRIPTLFGFSLPRALASSPCFDDIRRLSALASPRKKRALEIETVAKVERNPTSALLLLL